MSITPQDRKIIIDIANQIYENLPTVNSDYNAIYGGLDPVNFFHVLAALNKVTTRVLYDAFGSETAVTPGGQG